MTTYTHTASSQRFGHLRAHLPAYVVGIGATAALTAGALIVFLSLAAFVAFNGIPFGGSSDDAGAAYLDPSVAPGAAATALGAGPGAVARKAASDGTGQAARSAAAAAAGSGGSGSGGGPSGTSSSGQGPTGPGVSTSPGDVTSPPINVPPLPSTSGSVADAVQGVDNAAGTNLSGATGGATGAADGAANQAGGAPGRSGLGGQAGGAVRGAADRVLGSGRAGSLLGR